MTEIEQLVSQHGYVPCQYAHLERRSCFFQKKMEAFEYFVYFRYLSKYGSYDVTLGVQSVRVREYLSEALRGIYGEDFAEKFLDPLEWPCLSMFNADTLMKKWPRGTMRITKDAPLAVADLFHDAIRPTFETVCDYSQLLNLLLRDDSPFEWWRSSISARLAQIVVLSSMTRSDWSIVRSRIKRGEDLLFNDYHAGTRSKYFVNDLYQYCSEHPPTIDN
jgi:hypothetical protein